MNEPNKRGPKSKGRINSGARLSPDVIAECDELRGYQSRNDYINEAVKIYNMIKRAETPEDKFELRTEGDKQYIYHLHEPLCRLMYYKGKSITTIGNFEALEGAKIAKKVQLNIVFAAENWAEMNGLK